MTTTTPAPGVGIWCTDGMQVPISARPQMCGRVDNYLFRHRMQINCDFGVPQLFLSAFIDSFLQKFLLAAFFIETFSFVNMLLEWTDFGRWGIKFWCHLRNHRP